ncbi:MAG TPA: S8 family serine peptidase, partial [Acidimicrobiales bacterium]|nr:S8 family serine peptidase [Acidimicrobiales bacterium]
SYSPASAPSAITVGSTTSSDARSSFSNYGTCVDLFAPGSSIRSAWYTSDTATNTISGTSMASPHVAGVAALYLGQHPDATPAEVAAALVGGATPGKVSGPGSGSPNLLVHTGMVVEGAALKILLDTQPDAAQDFAFTGCRAGTDLCSSFSLDDDLDPTLRHAVLHDGIEPGDYTLSVDSVPGWDLTGLSCDGDHVADLAAGTLTVTVPESGRVTCTVTEAGAAITIVQDSRPDDAQDFTVHRCDPSGRCEAVTLDDDSDPTLPSEVTVAGLDLGTWTLTEDAVPGWRWSSLSCDGDHTADLAAGRVTFDLDAHEHLRCTFTAAEAAITIVTESDPVGPQDFAFTGCGALGCAEFSLDDDGDAALPDRVTYRGVAPGTYTIAEAAVPGWALADLSCDTGETIDLSARRATIDLGVGERVTCTFVNRQTRLSVSVDADPADGHDFAFTGCGPRGCGPFSLDDDDDPALADRVDVTGLEPGTYSVSLAGHPDWTLLDLSCTTGESVDLASGTATIELVEGEQTKCTYTLGATAITVVQVTPPGHPTDFTFDGCIAGTEACASFTLDDDDDATLPGSVTATGLAPGSYSVTQRATEGWDLHTIGCDADEDVDLAGGRVTVTLTAGEHVTCWFTDADPTTVTVVPFEVDQYPWEVADAGGYAWTTLPDVDRIARIDPYTGAVTSFPTPGVDSPRGLIRGLDGNLWFVGWQSDTAGRLDPETGELSVFSTGADTWPWSLTNGPDGKLWIAGRLCDCIRIMDPATGTFTSRWAGVNDPLGPTVGPDGNVWVVGYLDDQVARLVPGGGATSYPLTGMDDAHNLTVGPDGFLWVSGYTNDTVGRVDPATGAVNSWRVAPRLDGVDRVITDLDGRVWATGHHNERIGLMGASGAQPTVWPATGVHGPYGLSLDDLGNLWLAGVDSPYTVAQVLLPDP